MIWLVLPCAKSIFIFEKIVRRHRSFPIYGNVDCIRFTRFPAWSIICKLNYCKLSAALYHSHVQSDLIRGKQKNCLQLKLHAYGSVTWFMAECFQIYIAFNAFNILVMWTFRPHTLWGWTRHQWIVCVIGHYAMHAMHAAHSKQTKQKYTKLSGNVGVRRHEIAFFDCQWNIRLSAEYENS